jgi:hypothetical protein
MDASVGDQLAKRLGAAKTLSTVVSLMPNRCLSAQP